MGLQKAKRNVEEWEALAIGINERLESIKEAVKDKAPSAPLQALVTKYSKSVFRYSTHSGLTYYPV
jgi:hypothetical protein